MTALVRRPNDQLEHELLVTWLEEAHVGLCVLDNAGKVVMLNSAAGRKLHVDPIEQFQAPIANLLANVQCPIDVMRWMLAPGQDDERQIRGAANTDQRLLVKASTVRRGESVFRVLAISDVTALWHAQEATRLLSRQWDALDAALTISDPRQPDCPITYVNPRFEELSGYSAAECLGRNCRFMQGQDTQQPGVAQMRTAILGHQPVQVVLRNYRKDGSMFWVEVSISPVHDSAGELSHFVAIQHLRSGPQLQSNAR